MHRRQFNQHRQQRRHQNRPEDRRHSQLHLCRNGSLHRRHEACRQRSRRLNRLTVGNPRHHDSFRRFYSEHNGNHCIHTRRHNKYASRILRFWDSLSMDGHCYYLCGFVYLGSIVSFQARVLVRLLPAPLARREAVLSLFFNFFLCDCSSVMMRNIISFDLFINELLILFILANDWTHINL